jgi:hypothetical protein
LKLALPILAAVLMLAGCGQAKDPFVGTWHAQAKDGWLDSLVISKHGTGYLVATVSGADSSVDDFGLDGGGDSPSEGVGVLGGHGDTLTVSMGGGAPVETIRLTVSPHNRLQAIDEGVAAQKGPGYVFFVLGLMNPGTLVRVSDSTTAPTPSP